MEKKREEKKMRTNKKQEKQESASRIETRGRVLKKKKKTHAFKWSILERNLSVITRCLDITVTLLDQHLKARAVVRRNKLALTL